MPEFTAQMNKSSSERAAARTHPHSTQRHLGRHTSELASSMRSGGNTAKSAPTTAAEEVIRALAHTSPRRGSAPPAFGQHNRVEGTPNRPALNRNRAPPPSNLGTELMGMVSFGFAALNGRILVAKNPSQPLSSKHIRVGNCSWAPEPSPGQIRIVPPLVF